MRSLVLRWAAACSLLLLATQSGCSTVLGTVDSEEEQFRSKIFVGIRYADWCMNGGGDESGLFKVCFFYDLFPSAALDVALLPFTLLYELFRSKEPWKKPHAVSP